MSEVSKLYSSNNIYKTGARGKSSKGKNGDVKHIVFKDGNPVKTEIIKVVRADEEKPESRPGEHKVRRVKPEGDTPRERPSNEDVLHKKKTKLSERLKRAIYQSLTLWSEKDGIWISYQGSKDFLVKQFGPANRVLDSRMMSLDEIVESEIPNILSTSWKVM